MVLGYEEVDETFKKPRINTKLNLPATVTLKLNKDVAASKLENVIARQNQDDTCKDNGDAVHLAYSNREWIFRVPHWSKYGLGDSDEDEQEESKQIEQEDIRQKTAYQKAAVQ